MSGSKPINAIVPWMRVGGDARIAHVEFGDSGAPRATTRDTSSAGPHVTFDTRIDPSVSAQCAFTRASAGRPSRSKPEAPDDATTDARGYVGIGSSDRLALRGQLQRSDGPLPEAEQSLLGGRDSLRGYRTGHRAGDSMAAVSAEVRVPLNSPLRMSKLGVKAFIDAGTVWNSGTSLGDQPFERGIGGGVFLGAAVMKLDLDIAWPEDGQATRPFRDGNQFLGLRIASPDAALAYRPSSSVASLAALSASVSA